MCGLAGLFHRDGGEVDIEPVLAMAELLRHRGPDHTGHHVAPGVALVHNRLSLLDPSPGAHQPFLHGRQALVYNGEIYNFQALRAALEEDGDVFTTTSDTEVLARSLARHGVRATLSRLRGMFAFAFVDLDARRLVLARDRAGIKPLFYAEHGRRVAFASEWKALWALLEPPLDEVLTLFSVLGHADKHTERCLFRGLHQVEPGTFVVADDTGLRVERYHHVLDDLDETIYRELDAASLADVRQRFAERFDHAVDSMLVADAPLGAFVSGGVDSGLIAATARRTRDVSLFSSDVVGRHSEIEDARATAAALGAPLDVHAFQPERFVERWTAATWQYEAPIVTHTNAVPFADVAALARDHGVKATLTGEGADELFLGYPQLLTRRYRRILGLPYRLLDALYRRLPGFSRFASPTPGLLSELEVEAQNYSRQRLRRDALARLDFVPARQRAEHVQSVLALREGLAALLWRNDRMGMSASIEARFPFLDEELVRFAIHLPLRYKLRNSARWHDTKHPFVVDKWIVRDLAERRLPHRLAHKRKNGFPMYGHHAVRVHPEAFRDGFWPWLVGLDSAGVEHMVAHSDPYWTAKAASVEIWGRLFVLRHSLRDVEDHVRRHVTMQVG